MSHFYAGIEGSRGPATRCGTKGSGHYGHIRGWNIGGIVAMRHDFQTGQDMTKFILTDGSNGDRKNLIFEATEEQIDFLLGLDFPAIFRRGF